MGYLDNLDNEFSKKTQKIEKKFINMFFYLYIESDLNFIQFHYRLIVMLCNL
jgi:hypothetical protein